MKIPATLSWFARVAALGAFSTALPAATKTTSDANPFGAAFEAKVRHTMQAWGAPGIVVVVVRDGQTIHSRGYGTRVVGEERPVDSQTRVHVASHSKAVTATALAMLVDNGKLSWDDRVVKYIPEFALPEPALAAQVTVRDLVLHRSGLTAKAPGGLNNGSYGIPELLAALRTEPLAGHFRDRQIYSNVGIALAGEIVARVSGMPWEKFVHERIFAPLGMVHSYTSNSDLQERFGPPAADKNIFLAANKRNGAVIRGDWRGIGTARLYAPAGGIVSTGDDLAKWMNCLLHEGQYEGGRLLSNKSLHETWQPGIVCDPAIADTVKPVGVGSAGSLGWIVLPYAGRRIVQAPGAFMSSVVALIPEERLGVAVASNANFAERARWEKLYLVNAVAMSAVDAALGLPDRDWSAEFDAAVNAQSARAAARN